MDDDPINGTPVAILPSIDPRHPCQTPYRSYPRHYWISESLPDGKFDLLRQRCTTCGLVEDALVNRWDGQ